ncbi:hypothetical protein C6501_06575 [Candidatus Poribacteria bacterium]|nr:MAG: hypothetical protein C6501_06575 [Candidatus Poribacteria bacterium]
MSWVETVGWASDIDVARAESALERAKEQLATDAPDLNRPRAEAALARAQNRIKVASDL